MHIMDLLEDILPDEIDGCGVDEHPLYEARIIRQFRRYGNTLKRQFRCTSGPKQGRLVTSPEKCGIRKDPKRVRIGKRSARIKKGQRIRKTLFTKRRTPSKRVTRFNKYMSGKLNEK